MRRSRSACCARAASGHATAAPPRTPRNSRRRMSASLLRTRHRNGSNEHFHRGCEPTSLLQHEMLPMSQLGSKCEEPALSICRPVYPRKPTLLGAVGTAEKCHVWTAPSWQELSSRKQHWSVQPCVRPLDAVHMTAGHNALRGSGPDQKLAFDNAMALKRFPADLNRRDSQRARVERVFGH